MLWRALGDVEAGFFIDVGAQHPIKDSVSKVFSEHGWRGIHVEPTPEFSEMLRADRPNETVISAVVSNKHGAATFFDIAGTGLSTGHREIAEAHAAAGHPHREITVPTISLDDLLALAPSDTVHWLKIDVEGMEREVLESWRTSVRRPWIVIIEANLPSSQTPSHEAWEDLILSKGYHHVYYDGLNRFYINDAHRDLDDHFALPPNIFDGFQFDPLSDHGIIIQHEHQAKIESLESTIDALRNRVVDMRLETDALSEKWRIEAERRIADVRRAADAKMSDLRDRERKTTEIRLAEIAARERDGAIAAAADKARLEQQIAALRAESESYRAIASARETDLIAASERDIRRLTHDANVKVAALQRDLVEAKDRIESLRTDMAKRERELLAQGEDALKRFAAVVAARLETRLAEERIVLQASEERVAGALVQLRETQRVLDRERNAAVAQERAIRHQMHEALDLLRAEAQQDAERLRVKAERQRAESQLLLIDAHDRIVAAERMAADRALAHHSELLEQTEAFQGEIARVTDAALERERYAQLRIIESERREQQAVAAAHAEKVELAKKLRHSKARMRAVTSSRSWALARPLRWLLREQMIDQPSNEPALALLSSAILSPVGHAEPKDVMNTTFPPAQSVVDLLSLPPLDLIHQSFQMLLGRAPSSSEQRARERSLHLGCGRIAMIADIHQSVEANDLRRRRRAQGSDNEFIEWLYRHYLGRNPDPDGFVHYEGLIKRKNRAAVEADVAASNEAANYGSLSYELERLVKLFERRQQWWRWFSWARLEWQIRNIENEVNAVRIAQNIVQSKEESQTDMKSISTHAEAPFDLPVTNDNELSLPPRDRHAIFVLSSVLPSSAN